MADIEETDMSFVRCADCAYWLREQGPESHMGQCRRNAPLPEVQKGGTGNFIAPMNFRTVWPYTRYMDGCGNGSRGTFELDENMRDQSFDVAIRNAARQIGR